MTKLDRAKNLISGKTSELKEILKKLETITDEGCNLLKPLGYTIVNDTKGKEAIRVPTTSSSAAEIIIGRDKERDEIVRMLHGTMEGQKSWVNWALTWGLGLKEHGIRLLFTMLSLIWAKIGWARLGLGQRMGPPLRDCEPSSSNGKCYSVIGIYGIPGSGKTTLAQHVCSYERTVNYFFPIMWIHLSQNFDVRGIYGEMLEAASGKSSHDRVFSNLDTLRIKLEAELSGKRFLLVLDDVWPVKDVRVLDQLLSPLKVGKRGSKVLVTSRSADAVMSLGAQNPMRIPDMDKEDFFKLFMHYALDGASLDGEDIKTFQMIGKQIMKKLRRSPLAARIVGAQLRKNLNTMFWQTVKHQDLLSETVGTLWWSYRQLDEQVKRCFAYCSMFPPGYVFERDNLVKLWMAEDFIKISTHSVEQMEIVGRNCFNELVSCSFLQARKNTDGSENKKFSLHDLVHDLAMMVSGKDCFRVEDGDQITEFPPDVRHIIVRSYDPRKFIEQICKLEKLRTLIIVSYGFSITIESLERMMNKLKKLRVVQAPVDGQILMIPSCVCDLKHLRSLTFTEHTFTTPRLRKVILPRNLGKLYHLQILDLPHGGVLEFSDVKNMSRLVSLRHIRNSHHRVEFYSDISGFPGVGELRSLRELSDFTVKKEEGYDLQQLERLNHLRGSLRLSGLENVESREKALQANLTDKEYLTALTLAWSWSSWRRDADRVRPDIQLEILEGLRPPSQLTELEIYGYGGVEHPSWLTQSFRSLKCLKFKECYNLRALPDISQHFIHLGELTLFHLPKLERLPRLPHSLKCLIIDGCDALVVTCQKDVETIRSLINERVSSQVEPTPEEIDRSPDDKQPDRIDAIMRDIFGRTLPPRLIQGQTIEEDYFNPFLFSTSMDMFNVSDCAMTDTVIHNFLRVSTSLTWLVLSGLPFLRSIPCEVMKSPHMLQHLFINRCAQLTCLRGPNHLSNLRSLEIVKCPNLVALQEDEKVQVLELTIDDINLVPQILSTDGFASLRSLTFMESEGEGPGNEEILNQLASLTFLNICACNWNRLPENLMNLTCLRLLSLQYCQNICSLPTLPASLRVFKLNTCNQSFMESCQTAGHRNFRMIAHVPWKDIFHTFTTASSIDMYLGRLSLPLIQN